MSIDIILERPTPVNIPTDPSAYRAWVESLSQRDYALAFGVGEGARVFVCPTTGKTYIDPLPTVYGDYVWARCRCCDAALKIYGVDSDYDSGNPQKHCYPIVEGL